MVRSVPEACIGAGLWEQCAHADSVPGYYPEDANLDGATKYTRAGNDRDPTLLERRSTTPNNVFTEQLP